LTKDIQKKCAATLGEVTNNLKEVKKLGIRWKGYCERCKKWFYGWGADICPKCGDKLVDKSEVKEIDKGRIQKNNLGVTKRIPG